MISRSLSHLLVGGVSVRMKTTFEDETDRGVIVGRGEEKEEEQEDRIELN